MFLNKKPKVHKAYAILVACSGFMILSNNTFANIEWDLYGRAAVGVGPLNDGDKTENNIYDHGSRVGFRGSNEFDGGIAIDWQVESGINIDDGSGELASRDSFIGLGGDFGRFKVGYFGTPVRQIGRNVDMIYGRPGDNRSLIRTDNIDGRWGGRDPGWDDRWGNSIGYYSPEFSGFNVELQYSTDPGGGESSDNPEAYSASFNFANELIWAGVGYEEIDKGSTNVNASNPSQLRLGSTISIMDFAISALYQRSENQQGIDGNDRNVWGVGANYKLSPRVTVGTQYYQAGSSSLEEETGAEMLTGEVEYRVQTNTRLYFSVAKTWNEKNSRFDSSRGVLQHTQSGEDSLSAAVAVRYDF